MFLHNFNGGPEIQLSKNDDIYVSFQSVSVKEYFSYSVIKELLTASSAGVHSSMYLGLSNDLELSVIPEEREVGSESKVMSNINKDNKFIKWFWINIKYYLNIYDFRLVGLVVIST